MLGNNGGFEFIGQNIYAKAIKFDPLERTYKFTAKLPDSLNGTLSQNFVNGSLPSIASGSNPCSNTSACQISIIILSTPILPFLSNAKDSILRSMFVDLSIQETELVSPNVLIQIQDQNVTGLVTPIQMTMPLTSPLNTSDPNRTLGCGYLDTKDSIFKEDGLSIVTLTSTLVTCSTTHLTAFGVEEYTSDLLSSEDSQNVISAVPLDADTVAGLQVNRWNSWAIYCCIAMGIAFGVVSLWTYRRDKRDSLNVAELRLESKKLYIKIFLDPILSVRQNKEDTDKLVATTQQLKQEKTKNKKEEHYEQLDGNIEDSMRNSILPPPKPNTIDPPISVSPDSAQVSPDPTPEVIPERDFFADTNVGFGETAKSRKTVKKKKKKKKVGGVSQAGFDETVGDFRQNGMFGTAQRTKQQQNEPVEEQHNIFFEGGAVEFGVQLEGGSEEDGKSVMSEGMDDAAETIKSKRSKKKAKKKRANSSARGSQFGSMIDPRDHQAPQVTDQPVIEDFNETVKTAKSGKKKKKGLRSSRANSLNRSQNLNDDDDIKFNSQIGGFNIQREKSINNEEQPEIQADMEHTTMSKASAKKKKKGKRAGSRSSGRGSSKGSNDDGQTERPDYEAEVIIKKKSSNVSQITRKEDLLKPLSASTAQRKKSGLDQEAGPSVERAKEKVKPIAVDNEEKGFDTLMAEPLDGSEDQKPKKGGKSKKKKTAASLARAKKFQQQQAGCCVFFCWNCRESHRVLSLPRHYNEYLSRTTRLLILFTSFYMWIMLTGFLVDGPDLVAEKSQKSEQLVQGMMVAMSSRIWIIIITNFMRHTKREKIYSDSYNMRRARAIVICNNIRYWFGVFLSVCTIMACVIYVFILSGKINRNLLKYWAYAFMFTFVIDFTVVECLMLLYQTIATLVVGSAPDSCGCCRNCFLCCILQSIKDTVR